MVPTAPVLRAAHCQVEEAADWREGRRATRSLSPGGRATETWEQGLAVAAARNVEPPPTPSTSARLGRDPRPRRAARAPPPTRLTVGSL